MKKSRQKCIFPALTMATEEDKYSFQTSFERRKLMIVIRTLENTGC